MDPGCYSYREMGPKPTLGCGVFITRCGCISALSQGATRVACWLHEPQPINNHSVGLRFPYSAEWYRLAGCVDLPGLLEV